MKTSIVTLSEIEKYLYKTLQILLFTSSLFIISSCEKDKKPWPVFPKEEVVALTTPVNLPFIDSLNYGTTVAEYAIPPGWLEAVVSGAKEDRGWAYRKSFGTGASGCFAATAFGGNNGTDNTYLIVGPFNFQQYTSLTLKFDARLDFDASAGNINFKYSANYPGSGNPEATGVQWNPINELNAVMPTTYTGGAYVNVAANFTIPENGVFIAIQFSGASAGNSRRYNFDNFNLSGS
jgi:hypothetical protein